MGISKGSVWGNIKQSVGPAVGYRLKGQNVVRQKPLGYNDANTLEQQKNRKKQAVLVALYRQFRNIVQRMYSGMPETFSDYNSFVSLNHPAITVEDNLISFLNYDRVVLSKGSAQNVSNVITTKNVTNTTITFDTTYDGTNGFPSDIVNICGYDPDEGRVVFINYGTVLRSSGSVVIPDEIYGNTSLLFVTVKNVNNVPSNTLFVQTF